MERKRSYSRDSLRGRLTQETYNKVYKKYCSLIDLGNSHRETILECQKKFGYAQPNAVYKIIKIKQDEQKK